MGIPAAVVCVCGGVSSVVGGDVNTKQKHISNKVAN